MTTDHLYKTPLEKLRRRMPNPNESKSSAWPACPDAATTIAFALAFSLVVLLPSVLNDGDTLWQIRTGEWMLDHRAIPWTDPFSYTAGTRPWYPHEWLAELLVALAWRGGGFVGVMMLTAVATALTAATLLHHARRFLPGVYAVVALAWTFSCAAPSLLARPHVLAWPCLALWCCGLTVARSNRTAPQPWLLPVMLVWVNLHGSFIIGILLAGAFMVEALFDPGTDRRRVLLGWGAFVAAAVATTLLNPAFIDGLLFPFHMNQMKTTVWIGEWQQPDFQKIQPVELTILAALALGFSGKVPLPPVRIVLFLGLIHGALSHGRHGQLLGLIGVPILAEPLGLALGRGAAPALGFTGRLLAAGAGILAVATFGVRLTLPLDPERTGATFAATVEQVPALLRARPVLNDYSLGGLLIFHGERPFIDSRADLYGDAFLTEYQAIVGANQAALDRALTRYGIAWTIFPAEQPVVGLLDRLPGWHRLFESNGLVVHARTDATPGGR